MGSTKPVLAVSWGKPCSRGEHLRALPRLLAMLFHMQGEQVTMEIATSNQATALAEAAGKEGRISFKLAGRRCTRQERMSQIERLGAVIGREEPASCVPCTRLRRRSSQLLEVCFGQARQHTPAWLCCYRSLLLLREPDFPCNSEKRCPVWAESFH